MRNRLTKRIVTEEILFLLFTIIMLIPVYYFMVGAFKTRTEIVQHPLTLTLEMLKGNGLNNFAYVWRRLDVGNALKNNVFITGGCLLIEVVAGSLAGFTFSRIKRKGFNVLYSFVVTIMVVPFMGCLLAQVIESTQIGIYGSIWAAILILTAWHLPFTTFLFTEFMAALPKELEDSAYIDGCSTFGIYSRVFLPLLKPVIATCVIRSGMGAWNDFIICDSFLNPTTTPTLMVGLYKFFGSRASEYGYAFAGMLIASLPIIVLYVFLQKYFIKGMTAGAVKG